mmetsp:Transcript_7208/g.11293  ORF Transcript_7208/g.11293 Transcript_7208/m.11293 type:complete len:266 (-) Transcript_7208:297-1094(-)
MLALVPDSFLGVQSIVSHHMHALCARIIRNRLAHGVIACLCVACIQTFAHNFLNEQAEFAIHIDVVVVGLFHIEPVVKRLLHHHAFIVFKEGHGPITTALNEQFIKRRLCICIVGVPHRSINVGHKIMILVHEQVKHGVVAIRILFCVALHTGGKLLIQQLLVEVVDNAVGNVHVNLRRIATLRWHVVQHPFVEFSAALALLHRSQFSVCQDVAVEIHVVVGFRVVDKLVLVFVGVMYPLATNVYVQRLFVGAPVFSFGATAQLA